MKSVTLRTSVLATTVVVLGASASQHLSEARRRNPGKVGHRTRSLNEANIS